MIRKPAHAQGGLDHQVRVLAYQVGLLRPAWTRAQCVLYVRQIAPARLGAFHRAMRRTLARRKQQRTAQEVLCLEQPSRDS